MEWTIRLEVKTGRGEGESLDLATITRPAAMAAAAEVGLRLVEAKVLLAGLQASMVRTQLAEHAALDRVCPGCRAVLRVKDSRPRRLQTLFGALEVEAPRLKACPCRGAVGKPGATSSPVRDLLRGARCTPELERVQAERTHPARAAYRDRAGCASDVTGVVRSAVRGSGRDARWSSPPG